MHGHAKWGTKKGSTLIHASSALTPISTCTPPTAVQNIYLFCVSPNCKINRDVEGDVAGWKCKLCANETS